ncbi:MAG: flavin reductase family protein [Solobacterium sp.]|nr:flavin reductase family protein [Solobacterium sp.]
MRRYIDKKHIFTPLPVLLLGTYDENGTPNAMNAAWGGQIDSHQIIVSLSKHKTTDNLLLKQAFTVSFANRKYTAEADYLGIASGNKVNKIERAGLHAMKAEKVDAPVFEEFPLALECEVEKMEPDGGGYLLYGRVLGVNTDESIMTDGVVDLGKLEPIMFDSSMNLYRVIGEVVGNAFSDGKKFM